MLELKNGYKAYKNREYNKAIILFEIVLKQNPFQTDAYVLKGLSHFQLQQYHKSKVCLDIAHKKTPKDQVVLAYLLESLIQLEENKQALSLVNNIISELSNQVKLIKIKLLESVGKTKDAIALGESLDEKTIQKYSSLATNYEKINEIELAEKYAKYALELDFVDFKSNYVLSKILIRKKKFKKAKASLLNIKKKDILGNNLSLYYSLKAQIYEKQGRYNKAFKNYKRSNRNQKKLYDSKDFTENGYYSIHTIAEISRYLDFKKQPIYKERKQLRPIFMIGFPRSGTTLLDQLLSSHSMIEVIEEQPMINGILDYFIGKESLTSQFESLTNEEISNLQNHYLKEISKNKKTTKSIVIDKLPLNMIHMSLIYHIFPNAKFIISTRDYRDVALSCYFQSFVLNQAMSNFLDWNTTNRYLGDSMSLTNKSLDTYPIQHHWVKYENLVDTPFEEVKKVLNFLDLDWEESVKGYRSNIKGKTINTPSYSEVSKKIHKKNKNRWKNYKKQTAIVDRFWK